MQVYLVKIFVVVDDFCVRPRFFRHACALPVKEASTSLREKHDDEGDPLILLFVPQQFEYKHDYSEEYPIAHRDQREVAFREADSDEASLTRAHRFLRIQLIFLAILEPVLS